MPHFFLRLNPPRGDFGQTMTGDERALMGRHVGYLQGLLAEGRVLAFGPVADPVGFWGMGIAEVGTVEAARAIVDADPVILADEGFSYDILPMPSAVVRGAPADPSEDARPGATA